MRWSITCCSACWLPSWSYPCPARDPGNGRGCVAVVGGDPSSLSNGFRSSTISARACCLAWDSTGFWVHWWPFMWIGWYGCPSFALPRDSGAFCWHSPWSSGLASEFTWSSFFSVRESPLPAAFRFLAVDATEQTRGLAESAAHLPASSGSRQLPHVPVSRADLADGPGFVDGIKNHWRITVAVLVVWLRNVCCHRERSDPGLPCREAHHGLACRIPETTEATRAVPRLHGGVAPISWHPAIETRST